MIDLTGKMATAIAFVLTIVSYLSDVVPVAQRNKILVVGLVLTMTLAVKPKFMTVIAPRILEKCCKNYSNEKYFRFVNITKTVTVFPDGKGLIYTTYEVLNEGKNCMRRFPHKLSTSMSTINDSIDSLKEQNNFEVTSLDGHSLKWETVKDNDKKKSICLVYKDKLKPGDRRKYSVRYEIPEMYKTKRDDLGENACESSSFTSIHICDKYI